MLWEFFVPPSRPPWDSAAEADSDLEELVPEAAAFGGSTRVARRAGAAARTAARACGAAVVLSGALAGAAAAVAARRRSGAAGGREQRLAVAELARADIVAAEVPSEAPWWGNVPVVGQITVTTTLALDVARSMAKTTTEPDWFSQLGGGSGAGTALAPSMNMNDGNACADDEEVHEHLCYKKCAALTQDKYPVRTSPWTCCESKPCTPFNQVHDAGICSGFDVAGDVEGSNACPHRPGTCLNNEELFMGMCYKKCSLLIPEYPIRYASATCCKETGLACLATQGVTLAEFDIGGGAGDGDPHTPARAHPPLPQLTEERV